MLRLPKLSFVFGALLVAAACDSATTGVTPTVSEPEVGPPPPRGNHIQGVPDRGPVASSVTGSGTFRTPGGLLRTFSFNALDQRGTGSGATTENAVVVGQFDLQTFDDRHFHGIITCFVIVGNGAFIGGQVRQATPFPVTQEVGFFVEDNRPPGATPDRLSLLALFGNDATRTAAFCNPNDPNELDEPLVIGNVVRGHITVRP